MGQLEQFLSDIAPNGDWQPLIDYINQNYVSKDKIREKQIEKEFELQQKYKDFNKDNEWKRYKELLEEN